MVKCLDTNTHS
uniref:Uncharacterized protein n=1 Tax=Anguilla anguilla TaxID=7936 RepID=A0A0E9R9Q7_ANGAN